MAAAQRYCGGVVCMRPVFTGLHAVADVEGVDAERISREALDRGTEAMPLPMCFDAAETANGLLFGFGPVRPEDSAVGMRRLAAAIEAAQSRPPAATTGTSVRV
jgi:DNA-binding transcriptional MocR family regulator